MISGKQYASSPDSTTHKNFLVKSDTGMNLGGFTASSFMGRYTKEKTTLGNPINRKDINIPQNPLFVIFHPTNTRENYVSHQSGVIGLGMPSYQDSKHIKENFLYNLRASGSIEKSIVSYNITYKPDEWESEIDSYIQIGSISKQVYADATWLPTENWDTWGSQVSFSFFKHQKKIYPFVEFEALAVFDP